MELRKKKIVTVIFVLMILFYSFFSIMPVYATEKLDFGKADDFITRGQEKQGISEGDLKQMGDDFSELGKVLVYIGAAVLVGGLAYIGIMYMVSPPEKQGKLKQQLIGLLLAGVVIFGAFSIWKIIVTILANTIG